MPEYVSCRLTKEEYDLIDELTNAIALKGLPMEVFGDIDLKGYLESVGRESLSKGAIVGIGIKTLLYMMENKKVE